MWAINSPLLPADLYPVPEHQRHSLKHKLDPQTEHRSGRVSVPGERKPIR